jgi:Spy/CpxP family protein refolding chaperone
MKTSRIAVGVGLLALTVTLITASVANAGWGHGRRGGERPEGGPHSHEGRGGPAEVLYLTDDQQAQFDALREAFHAEAVALRESGDADREALDALRESHREQFGAILTDEQKAQLQALHTERRANRPEARRGGRPGGHGRMGRGDSRRPDLGTALGLSEEQSGQMEALRGALHEQLQALRESAEGSREQAEALHQTHHEQIQALLTEEQRATLEQLRANRDTRRRPGRRGGPPCCAEAGAEAGETEAAEKTAGTQSRSWGSVKSGAR